MAIPPQNPSSDSTAPTDSSGSWVAVGWPSPIRMLTTVVRYVPLFLLLAFLAAGVSIIRSWGGKTSYSATGSFVSNNRRASSSIGGIAAQFGVSLAADGAQTPAFYSSLVKTRAIGVIVARKKFPIPGKPGVTGSLDEALGRRVDTSTAHLNALGDEVSLMLNATVAAQTGIITVSATGPSGEVAAALVANVLEAIDDFNAQNQRRAATAERKFAEQQLVDARAELNQAEERQQNFLRNNRGFSRTSDLVVEQEAIVREVTIRRQLYTSLVQSFEQARLAEVRDLTQITVIEQPTVPQWPNSRGRLARAAFAAVLGAGFGFLFMLLREGARVLSPRQREDLSALGAVLREMLDRIRHPFRRREAQP